jgi:excinuclease UvrABC nuclease subunit
LLKLLAKKKNKKISDTIFINSHYNAYTDKFQILSENKNKSGIYCFNNFINGKQYIGSSDNLRRRFMEYFNINHLESQNYMPICRALLKHGYSNSLFSIKICEYCEVAELLIREKYYINLLGSSYNTVKDRLGGG